jgi:hypothetical protein
VSIDGARGTVLVGPRDPAAPGFYRHGRLEYVGRHYLKFRDGPYFLKGGVDGPENLLGFKGFDNTFDQPGGSSTIGLESGLHRYLPHVADWGVAGLGDEDDPDFTSEQSGADAKGLIGLLNYLESVEVNSIYFLPMNLEGDGRETCPFIGYQNNAFDKTHYDVSKLAQWNTVFEPAQRHGILIQFVLAEMETGNQNYLDGGVLGPERKLFYRELSARFGHCLALKWNLSVEALYTVGLLRQFADYIDAVDPYDHPLAFHTQYLPSSGAYAPYSSVLGDARFDMTSLQGAPEHMAGQANEDRDARLGKLEVRREWVRHITAA